MTSATGEHPEVTEISALAEGALPLERSADVRAHLALCPLCAEVRDSLEEIRSLLGTLPGPSRMPDDVAGRIDAALAAEALLDATSPERQGEPGDVPGAEDADPALLALLAGDEAWDTWDPAATSHTSSPAPRTHAAEDGEKGGKGASGQLRPGSRVSRETRRPSAGPVGDRPGRGSTSRPAPRPDGRPAGAGGPGRTRPRRRWSRVVLTTACAAALIGFGGWFLQVPGLFSADGNAKSSASAVHDGDLKEKVFTRENLPASVDALLPGTTQHGFGLQGGENAPMRNSEGPATKAAPSPGATADACALRGTGRPADTPLAVESGRYEDAPSVLVVMADESDPGQVDAYLVDSASCELLLHRALPRG
ncbi:MULTISPECIES: anti-sigma factor [Streptomyces]|uniref:anti-sigma factor family protein n=1 Tax=Streptomyces TaxID=1883 RepID=UPI002174EF53|nr:hypothetical protein [Streptomyces sp. SCUT-3]